MKVYSVVHTMLLALNHLHTLWRKKVYLSDVEVEEAERWAQKLGECWKLMGWKATVWVHWTVCHSGWFVRKYRTMHFFNSVPTERRNSAYKVHIQNSFRGWSVQNPRVVGAESTCPREGHAAFPQHVWIGCWAKTCWEPIHRDRERAKEEHESITWPWGSVFYCATCACLILGRGSEKSF